jgi:hypothetical protein
LEGLSIILPDPRKVDGPCVVGAIDIACCDRDMELDSIENVTDFCFGMLSLSLSGMVDIVVAFIA